MCIVTQARHGAQFVTNSEIDTCSTLLFLPISIASQANYHTAIGFRWRNYNGSKISRRVGGQILIIHDISPQKMVGIPIVQWLSIVLVSVTKFWDGILRLCMWKDHTDHTNILDYKSSWLGLNQCDTTVSVTGKWDHAISTEDKIC